MQLQSITALILNLSIGLGSWLSLFYSGKNAHPYLLNGRPMHLRVLMEAVERSQGFVPAAN
jgi:hypothetical protein